MKTPNEVRHRDTDELRKAKRLEPMHKSGKERHALYSRMDDETDDELPRPKRESALDYLDDNE